MTDSGSTSSSRTRPIYEILPSDIKPFSGSNLLDLWELKPYQLYELIRTNELIPYSPETGRPFSFSDAIDLLGLLTSGFTDEQLIHGEHINKTMLLGALYHPDDIRAVAEKNGWDRSPQIKKARLKASQWIVQRLGQRESPRLVETGETKKCSGSASKKGRALKADDIIGKLSGRERSEILAIRKKTEVLYAAMKERIKSDVRNNSYGSRISDVEDEVLHGSAVGFLNSQAATDAGFSEDHKKLLSDRALYYFTAPGKMKENVCGSIITALMKNSIVGKKIIEWSRTDNIETFYKVSSKILKEKK